MWVGTVMMVMVMIVMALGGWMSASIGSGVVIVVFSMLRCT